jgi:hypothetical protein
MKYNKYDNIVNYNRPLNQFKDHSCYEYKRSCLNREKIRALFNFEKRPKEKYNLILRTKTGRKKLLWRTENFLMWENVPCGCFGIEINCC